ncbi:MAG TPA: hypothetical protein VKV39_06640 [Candidatus Sulfotelmatobacter sp.]|nr:hypothetical protein [Candidatus Sulfotelmatobacter sp.]
MKEKNAALTSLLDALIREYRQYFKTLPPSKLAELTEPLALWLLELVEPKTRMQ